MSHTMRTDTGLTAAEVAERVARGEINRVRRSDRAEYLDIAVRNLLTLFNALVVPAALALFLLGEYRDALAVSGMALTNLVLGLIQEVRAKRHLDRLTLLAETRTRVVRDGQVREVLAGDVVRDDLLLLAAGDTVVADGRVVESRFLEVDEALLTGESEPVPRQPGEPLLSGSFCVAGEGSYRAERVGAQSFAQRTAHEARSYRYTASPIQISINCLLAVLTAAAVVLCLGYFVLYELGDVPLTDLWRMIAATITSMVPQGLVLMATLAFVLGAVRMSRRGALVHRLNAVESMASIDTLCMDKTGTLTTNRLHLENVFVLDETMPEEEVRRRLRMFASASLDRGSKSLAALRVALGETETELLDQLPFKSQNRYSAVRVIGRPREPSGAASAAQLAAPTTEVGAASRAGQVVPLGSRHLPPAGSLEHVLVLGACESLRPFTGETKRWEARERDLLGAGLRLLLFAEAENAPDRVFAGSLDGFALRPLALVALSDELRPEARRVLEELASQGIRFKVLSGDHADTVRATLAPLAAGTNAPAIEALAQTPVVSGAELQAAADPAELIRTRCVFGRVSPAQKVEIIAALKKQGAPRRHDRRRRQRRAADQERSSGHRHGRRRRRQQDRLRHRAGDEQLRSSAANAGRRPHHPSQPAAGRQTVPGQERLLAGPHRRRARRAGVALPLSAASGDAAEPPDDRRTRLPHHAQSRAFGGRLGPALPTRGRRLRPAHGPRHRPGGTAADGVVQPRLA